MTIKAEEITFGYRRGAPALRSVSVTISAGEVTAIVGPNGAGKSTLLRILVGACRPWSGSVRLNGAALEDLPPADRAARLAFVSQRPTVAGPFTVEQVVNVGRYAIGCDACAVDGAIGAMELDEHRGRPVLELSVGQQQRVAIARALAQLGWPPAESSPPQPLAGKAFLADEPIASMDPRHAALTCRLIGDLAKAGAAVGVVLHDLSAALTWADRAVLMSLDGRVAAQGPADAVLTPAALSEVFGVGFELIEHERMRALIALAPEPMKPAQARQS